MAELLGRLPLALEQAGAYVRETRIALSAYLDRLRQSPAPAMARGRPRDRDPADTVATTWQVSLKLVQPVAGAMVLLEICAFLAPEEIPRALFTQQLDPVPSELAVLSDDPFALDEAVAGLRRFGLVKASEQTLIVHRLLQQVIRAQLDPHSTASRIGVAVRLLAEAFPYEGLVDRGAWPACAALLPHVLAATSHAEEHEAQPAVTAYLLDRAASYLQSRARYQEAQELFERALALTEARLGADHPDTASSLNNLVSVLYAQGDLDHARTLYERALSIRETRLGPDHPDTASSLRNLAFVLRDQGDLDRARRLFERALSIREAHLGADHPDTASSLSNLAFVLVSQGDLDRARGLYERALAIQQAHLAADHSHIAWTLNGLATVLRAQGDLDRARTLHQRALAIREKRLGPDHPDTATNRQDLARVVAALENRE